MSISLNGNNNPTGVTYNDKVVSKVFYNGTKVWPDDPGSNYVGLLLPTVFTKYPSGSTYLKDYSEWSLDTSSTEGSYVVTPGGKNTVAYKDEIFETLSAGAKKIVNYDCQLNSKSNSADSVNYWLFYSPMRLATNVERGVKVYINGNQLLLKSGTSYIGRWGKLEIFHSHDTKTGHYSSVQISYDYNNTSWPKQYSCESKDIIVNQYQYGDGYKIPLRYQYLTGLTYITSGGNIDAIYLTMTAK